MDPYVIELEDELRRRGLPRAEIGRLLGLDSKQLNRIFKEGTRRIQRHEAEKIDHFLGRTPAPASAAPGGVILPGPGMVPLFGLVGASSETRVTIADQNILGYVPMHPAQMGVRDPFALQVTDESMAPRYEPGETVYLAPNRWPRSGQDAVLVTRDSLGFLKRFTRRTDTAVVMHQLNPDKSLEWDLADVQAIHAVVGRG